MIIYSPECHSSASMGTTWQDYRPTAAQLALSGGEFTAGWWPVASIAEEDYWDEDDLTCFRRAGFDAVRESITEITFIRDMDEHIVVRKVSASDKYFSNNGLAVGRQCVVGDPDCEGLDYELDEDGMIVGLADSCNILDSCAACNDYDYAQDYGDEELLPEVSA